MYSCLLSFASIPNYQWLQSKDTGRNSSWIFFFFEQKFMTFYLPQFICPLCFFYSAFFFFAEKFFYSALDSIFENWNKVLSFLLKQVVVRVNDILQQSLPFAFDYSEFLLKPKHICTTTVKIKPLFTTNPLC